MLVDGAPRAEGSVPLPDGRLLAYADYGPACGTPVLLVPGAASGRLMSVGRDALEHTGVRLVSVDRPGLGRSTPDPGKSHMSVARDIGALLDALDLGSIPAIANSQGAPFGLAAAVTGAVSRLILASPSDEVARPDLRRLLPAGLGELVDRAVTEPETALAFFASLDASSMIDMVLGTVSSVDAQVYGDAAFREHFRRVLEDGFVQGPDGYARDTLLAMRPWDLALERIQIPVEVWHGALDTGHSPDLGASMASRIPGAAHHVVPHAGGSLLWAHPVPILRAALGHDVRGGA